MLEFGYSQNWNVEFKYSRSWNTLKYEIPVFPKKGIFGNETFPNME